MEEWKTIQDFPDYQVSNLGRVKSLKFGKEKILRQWLNSDKYFVVVLRKDGLRYKKTVHRLILQSFIPNTENKPSIDHINQNKQDNRLFNLRWADGTEQNINTPDKTLTRNIYKTKSGSYLVAISRYKVLIQKTLKTFEEAVAYRDSILNQTQA